jgi:hypothetical protein
MLLRIRGVGRNYASSIDNVRETYKLVMVNLYPFSFKPLNKFKNFKLIIVVK